MNKVLSKLLFLFIAFFFTTFQFNAQHKNSDLQNITLHLLSGDTLTYKLLEINEDHLAGYQKKNKRDVWKLKIYPNTDILYYSTSTLNKNWVYVPDSSTGNVLTKEHMEQYVMGKREAKENYRPIKHFALGLVSGVALGALDSYAKGFFNNPNSGLVIAVPVLSTLIVRTKNLKDEDSKKMNEEAILKNEYQKGFHSVKKTKNYIGSSSGSLLGVVLAIIANNIIGS
tara:strand:- start:63 stop:743 length:681 start_codon:yes stop_codon:yes gene_type:complete